MAEIGFYPKSVMLTDCRSLFDHIYAMTGSTAEMLLPDIHELREAAMPWRSALSEVYSDEFIELWWCDTVRQLADNLTKLATPSQSEFHRVLETNVIRLSASDGAKTYERPRPTQQAHAFWLRTFNFLTTWDVPGKEIAAQGYEYSKNVGIQVVPG